MDNTKIMTNGINTAAHFEISSPWRQKFLGLCGILFLLFLEAGCVGLIYYLLTVTIVNSSFNCDLPGLFRILLSFLVICTLPCIMLVFADRMILLARFYIGRTITVDGGRLTVKGKSHDLRNIARILTSTSLIRIKYIAYDKIGKPVCYWLDNYSDAENLLNCVWQHGCVVEENDSNKIIPDLVSQRLFPVYTYKDSLGRSVSCFTVCSTWAQRCGGWAAITACSASVLGLLYGCFALLYEFKFFYVTLMPVFVMLISILAFVLKLSDLIVWLYRFQLGKVIIVEGDCLTVDGCTWDVISLLKLVEIAAYSGNSYDKHLAYEYIIYDKSGRPVAYFKDSYYNAFLLRRWLLDGGCEKVSLQPSGFLHHLRTLWPK